MSEEQTNAKAGVIKLGLDIHKSKYVVVMQADNESAKSPQRFTPETFLPWAKKLLGRADRVVCCYEAGCFGYSLHRRLVSYGIENLVVRPRNWDEYGEKVKTDGRDAGELCSHLDRYLAGNKRALTPVRVPSEEEERKRGLSRQREVLANERKRLQNIGTSAGRYYGVEIPATWWKPKRFALLRKELPAFLVELLESYQSILVLLDQRLTQATAREEHTVKRALPVGLGALTASVLDKEFVDYSRFRNRRQVASYTGLCPGECSSGHKRRQGSINKHGNPRVRHMLLEAVWRMFYFQPDYAPIRHWKTRMAEGGANKKKMAVAIARRFAIDWWAIQTGQLNPEKVGLKMALPTCSSLYRWRKTLQQTL